MNQPNLDTPGVLEALLLGNIQQANELMKSVYRVYGRVVHGNHLGRTLGFPTANLKFPENGPFLLANGVYAVKIETGHHVYSGMVNAGFRPTVEGKTLTVEVHLFDFSGDLYGKTLAVSFYYRIRDEKRFDSIDMLVDQIKLDKQRALMLLS